MGAGVRGTRARKYDASVCVCVGASSACHVHNIVETCSERHAECARACLANKSRAYTHGARSTSISNLIIFEVDVCVCVYVLRVFGVWGLAEWK